MPLPLLLIGAAASAVAFGAKKGIDGRQKHSEADKKVATARHLYAKRRERFDAQEKATAECLEALGKQELEIGRNFNEFATLADELLNELNAGRQDKLAVSIPRHHLQKVESYSYTAVGVLATAVGAGAASVAATFAVSAGVMTLGVASTGTAIASLSGVAATNAGLAALGGGSLAAGGMGMAGGTMVLGATMAAPVIAVLGYAYDKHGEAALNNAEKASNEVKLAVAKLDRAEEHLARTRDYVRQIAEVLRSTYGEFDRYFDHLKAIARHLETAKQNGTDPGLDKVSDEVLRLINNGYALAAILVDMITTPLFRIKQANGAPVLDGNGAPVIQTDADGSMVLNEEELGKRIDETRRRGDGIDPA